MIKKVYRLKKKYQFNYVYKVGKTVGGKNLVLYYCPSKNKNIKVGISVSKKVGGAVVRNRTKRRIRESISPLLSKLKNNYNIIIVAKPASADATFKTLSRETDYLLKKAKLYMDEWRIFLK